LRVDSTTNEVKIIPVAAHTTPANSPPMSAARNCTLVFGMNMYRNVNTPVTSTYGVSRPDATSIVPNGSYFASACTALVCANVAIRPSAVTISAGPTTITLRYSLTRRTRLRGCSTRHTKLKDSSTFWIIDSVM
jgi:hypothetical protein